MSNIIDKINQSEGKITLDKIVPLSISTPVVARKRIVAFKHLIDTPMSYEGQNNKMLKVNGNSIEFIDGLTVDDDDNLTVGGNLTITGDLDFGDASTDILTITGYIQGSVSGKTYISLGTGTPGNLGTPQIDDVFIKGRLEVDGNLYADGKIYASAIERVTGGALNITLGSAVGDDFIIDTTGFVYKGNTDRVGIGTATPAEKLEVNGNMKVNGSIYSYAVTPVIQALVDTVDKPRIIMDVSGGAGRLYTTRNSGAKQALTFGIDVVEKMRVDISGNVGIGTTSPSALLNLKGNLSSALTGTVAVTNLSTAVVGVGTLFTTELAVGDSIKIGTEVFTVSVITNALNLTLDSAYQGATASGLTAYRDPTLFAIDNGDAINKLTVTSSGNVGIGTTTPLEKLHVYGGQGDTETTDGVIAINKKSSTGNVLTGKIRYESNGTSYGNMLFQVKTTASGADNDAYYTNALAIDGQNGNVGIGTTGPNVSLQVAGTGYFGSTYLSDYTNLGVNTLVAVGSNPAGFALIVNSSTVNEYSRISFGGRSTNSITKFLGSVEGGIETAGTDSTINGFVRFTTTAAGAATEKVRITSAGNIGIGTMSPASLLTVAGPISTQAPATKTAAYSMIATDSSLIFNGAASIILTLQAASSWTGRILYVKTIAAFTVDSASANVAPLGSATAGTAILAATAGKWAMLQSDGTNWVIMAGN